jgi:hypothetical protein
MLIKKKKTISVTFTVVTDTSLQPSLLYLTLQCSALHMFPKSFTSCCAFCFDVN